MRDMNKIIEEYYDKFHPKRKGAFYADEVYQIAYRNEDALLKLYHALCAGYTIGYKAGLRDAKKK